MGDFNGKNYNDEFIGDLVSFVASNEFQTKFEAFFVQHALQFTDGEEHKLVYYDLYQQFSHMFESQLEAFCRSKDLTQADFFRRCKNASVEDKKAKHYIDILLSSVEYDTFVKLMKIMRPVAEMRLSMSKGESKAADDKPASPAKSASSSSAKARSMEDNVDFSEGKMVELEGVSDSKSSSSSDSKEGSASASGSK